MRAVVTGGAGFIGSNLVDALLARDDEVVVVDDLSSGKRENVDAAARFVEVDIRDPALELDADVVFHLAAHADVNSSVLDPIHDGSVNVLGTVNVLEAARRSGAHVVFSSTGGVIYGEMEGLPPADETRAPAPESPYGLSKQAGEAYLAGWNRMYGSRHVVLRFGNVFGPRQDSGLEGGVIAIFLERLALDEPTTIFGDGEQTRDFVYVDDIVSALITAAGHRGGVFNAGTGVATSVNRIHELCRAAAGSTALPAHAPGRVGDGRRSVLDVTLIERELGWRAAVPLDEGLRRTWAWMQPS